METSSTQLLILLVFQCISSLTAYTLKNTTTCFVKDFLTLNCDPGEMIYIHQVYYGYSSTNQCTYSPGDCLIPDQHRYPCMGQQTCRLNLPPGGSGQRLDGCKQNSNYMHVRHSCIPEKKVVDICSGATLTSETGFIKSPNYPFNYPSNKKCTSSISVHRSQQLKLYVFDFILQSLNRSLGQCSDDLYIQTGTQSDTHCGDDKPLRHEPLTRTLRNQITLTFETDGSIERKGFWLYYEAYPPMPPTTKVTKVSTTVSTTLPTKPVSLVEVDQGLTSPSSNPTQPTGDLGPPQEASSISEPQQQRLPVAEAIIGAVIGTLLIVVVTLLIILVIQRKRSQTRSTTNHNHMLPSTSGTSVNTSHLKSDPYYNKPSTSACVDHLKSDKLYSQPSTSACTDHFKSELFYNKPSTSACADHFKSEPFYNMQSTSACADHFKSEPFYNMPSTSACADHFKSESYYNKPSTSACADRFKNDPYYNTSANTNHLKSNLYRENDTYPATKIV